MSEIIDAVKRIESLHLKIVKFCHGDSSKIEIINNFMSHLKFEGMLDGIVINGNSNRFLIIDGASWANATKFSAKAGPPAHVLWEESKFFDLLEHLIESKSEKKVTPYSRLR